MKRISLIGLALLTAGVAHGQVTKQGNGYLLRYKWTKGSTFKYTMTTTVNMGGQKQATPGQSMSFTMRVLDVKNGNATIRVNGTFGGNKMDEKMVLDNRGRVVGKASNSSMAQIANIALPQNAIPIGGTWKSDLSGNLPGGMGTMNANNTFKLVRVANVGGRNIAEIGVNGNLTGMAKMTVTGRYLMLVSDGSLSGMTMNTSGSFANPNSSTSQPMKFSAVTTLKRG
jgi:hypothetical protein